MKAGWTKRAGSTGLSTVVVLATLALAGRAQAPAKSAADPLDALNAARDTYDAAVAKARDRLAASLEKRVEVAKSSGRLDAVEEIKSARETYLADGTLPDSSKVAAEVRSFRSEWRLATRAYIAAMQVAERELTRADRLDEARQLQKERAVLESEIARDNPSPVTPEADPAELLQPNTAWKGFLKGVAARPGQTKKVANAEAMLRITGREGSSFRGTFQIRGGPRGVADIEGNIGKFYRNRDGAFREFSFMFVSSPSGRGPVGPATTYFGAIKGGNIAAAQRPFRNADMGIATAIHLEIQPGSSR